MDRFFEMLEKSVIVSSYIVVVTVTATVYLAVTGQVVPDLLQNVMLIIVGYFFGAGTAKAAIAASKR